MVTDVNQLVELLNKLPGQIRDQEKVLGIRKSSAIE
jgi:hypothetical protein